MSEAVIGKALPDDSDVIKVTEMKNGIPFFKVMYRSAQESVIGNAKISEEKVLQAVYFSEPQTQLLYRDVRRYREKAAIDQIKPVRVLDNPIKVKFFKRMIER